MTRMALLDSDVIAYRAAILTENASERDAIELAQRITDTWVNKADCDGYVECITQGTSFRRESWGLYKGNRKDKVRPKHLSALYARMRDSNACYHDGLEADDVIGILGTHPKRDGWVVVTIDKDLDQIAGAHFNPDKECAYEVSEDDADLYRWMQVLSGDSTDFYPGIPGVGQAKASRILEDVPLGQRGEIALAAYKSKDLTEEYFNQMVICATILTYGKDIPTCKPLLSDSKEGGTLQGLLQSIMLWHGL